MFAIGFTHGCEFEDEGSLMRDEHLENILRPPSMSPRTGIFFLCSPYPLLWCLLPPSRSHPRDADVGHGAQPVTELRRVMLDVSDVDKLMLQL